MSHLLKNIDFIEGIDINIHEILDYICFKYIKGFDNAARTIIENGGHICWDDDVLEKETPKEVFKFRELVEKSYDAQIKSFLNNSVIIDIPQLSNNTKLVKDIYPITEPHWILVRPQNKALSLVEIDDDESLISDIEKIKTFLRNTYPEQDVVFFEHGSGTITQNGEKFIQSAGKSVMFVHTHFCVLPKNVKGVYSKILEETKNIFNELRLMVKNIDAEAIKSKINRKETPEDVLAADLEAQLQGLTVEKPVLDSDGNVIAWPGQVLDKEKIKLALRVGALQELLDYATVNLEAAPADEEEAAASEGTDAVEVVVDDAPEIEVELIVDDILEVAETAEDIVVEETAAEEAMSEEDAFIAEEAAKMEAAEQA